MWSVSSRVWSVELRAWSVGCGAWSVGSVGCKVFRIQIGGIQSAEDRERGSMCDKCNAEYIDRISMRKIVCDTRL